jgi:hypothetical protein
MLEAWLVIRNKEVSRLIVRLQLLELVELVVRVEMVEPAVQTQVQVLVEPVVQLVHRVPVVLPMLVD